MRKSILFIPDISPKVGMGHFYRCLRCARYLKKNGWNVLLIAPEFEASIRSELIKSSISFKQVRDLRAKTVAKIAKSLRPRPQWIVTDHYKIDASWEKLVRLSSAIKIAAFDDDDGRRHACELIIRTNELSSHTKNRDDIRSYQQPQTRWLRGPRFYIPDISIKSSKRVIRSKPRLILFFIGGTASDAVFLSLLNTTVKAIAGTNVKVCAIAPVNFKSSLPKLLRAKVRLIRDYGQLGQLLSKSDLFVGSGGTITFDRLLFGLPGIIFSMAANQNKLSRSAAMNGSSIFLGSVKNISEHKLLATIKRVISNRNTFLRMCQRSSGIVDNLGGFRLNMHLLHFPISLRSAKNSDEASILKWRNNPRVRAASISTAKISSVQHHRWFQTKLRDRDCHILIAESSNGVVAVLRYDLSRARTTALVSIFLTPQVIGSGLGSEVLKAGTEWIRKRHKSLKRINAEIRPENVSSIRSFQSAGYRKLGRYYVINLHN